MKHRFVLVACALCAFSSVASAQAVNPPIPNPVGVAPATKSIAQRLWKSRMHISSGPVLQDLRRYFPLASSGFESHFEAPLFSVAPKAEDKTSPMIRKPEDRYQYLSLETSK